MTVVSVGVLLHTIASLQCGQVATFIQRSREAFGVPTSMVSLDAPSPGPGCAIWRHTLGVGG